MVSNYTSDYGLCQWSEEDKVLRTEWIDKTAKRMRPSKTTIFKMLSALP